MCFMLMMMTSCTDIFTEKQKKLVGNIFLVNPGNVEDKGYRLVLYENDYNRNMLNEYIESIEGNDTVLLVKGIDKLTCREMYYRILHHSGQGPLSIDSISKDFYDQGKHRAKFLYRFYSEVPECP